MESFEIEPRSHVERLKRVRPGSPLTALVPRVVAAGFGIIPLDAGKGYLEVAAAHGLGNDALRALSQLLKRDIRVVRVRESLVQETFARVYPDHDAINFHTFLTDDFLTRAPEYALLLEEKPFTPVESVVERDPARLAVLDYGYQSLLWNLDGPPLKPAFRAGATELCFDVDRTVDPPVIVIPRRKPVPQNVLVLARESFATSGGPEHAHGFRSHEVQTLPFMIHPTELQITGLREDGALELLIYDRVERVKPGDRRRFEVEYCFLSMGQRLRRRLVLTIVGLYFVDRTALRYQEDEPPWTAEHLRRWLFS